MDKCQISRCSLTHTSSYLDNAEFSSKQYSSKRVSATKNTSLSKNVNFIVYWLLVSSQGSVDKVTTLPDWAQIDFDTKMNCNIIQIINCFTIFWFSRTRCFVIWIEIVFGRLIDIIENNSIINTKTLFINVYRKNNRSILSFILPHSSLHHTAWPNTCSHSRIGTDHSLRYAFISRQYRHSRNNLRVAQLRDKKDRKLGFRAKNTIKYSYKIKF